MTVVVQIGNSDDKLSQVRWAEFVAETDEIVKGRALQIHFHGFSEPAEAWQNACWVFEFNGADLGWLKNRLQVLAARFGQDSIALTVGQTEMVKA